MSGRYDLIIQRLEQIIEHWFDKEELSKHLYTFKDGLCTNLLYDQDHLVEEEFEQCFSQYCEKFNKPFSIYFPVEGSFFLYRKAHNEGTMYSNPNRLHLAVFLLGWLRQYNV